HILIQHCLVRKLHLISSKTFVIERVRRSVCGGIDCFFLLLSIIDHITSHVNPIPQIVDHILIQHRLVI
ncbi:hypothetical protein PMAYCL1PPCAC_14287, partial [Pristionchus mayeri]